MKVIFFGTPEFAVPSLDAVRKAGHKVKAVVTVPDRQKGRGLKTEPSAVKQYAVEHSIPVLQPEAFGDAEFLHALKAYKADIFIVVAFRILPETVFSIPPLGSYNLHASLLPKYRGAAPIQWAIIQGETETGVTTFKLEQKVDTGNILVQKKCAIEPADSGGSLHDKLSALGAEAVVQTLERLERGTARLKKQDNSLATPAPKITKELCEIDWKKSAADIINLIRAMNPYPGAFFSHNGELYKVFRAEIAEPFSRLTGAIVETAGQLTVTCGEGAISILEIQKQGRKRMTAEEFLRGHSIITGS